jgi:hypothetical protein
LQKSLASDRDITSKPKLLTRGCRGGMTYREIWLSIRLP